MFHHVDYASRHRCDVCIAWLLRWRKVHSRGARSARLEGELSSSLVVPVIFGAFFFLSRVNSNRTDSTLPPQHLIWILRRDGETHEYRRHLGCGKVLQTDLVPMLMHQAEEDELSDVLLRLLLNLTSPTLLLYNEVLPKDGPNRRNFLHLVEILQSYKAAFSLPPVWLALCKRLKHVLEIVSARRNHFTFGMGQDRINATFTSRRFVSMELNVNYATTPQSGCCFVTWMLCYVGQRSAASKRKHHCHQMSFRTTVELIYCMRRG